MAEQWEEFAEMVESEDLDLKVVSADVLEIDTSEFPQLKQVMPGPLPGVFFFPAKTNYYYEFPGARGGCDVEKLLEFALDTYPEQGNKVYRTMEDFYASKPDLFLIKDQDHWDELSLSGEGDYVIMVYGPKCGWCKSKLPIFEEFARMAKDQVPDITVAWFNGMGSWSFGDRFKARPWPSVI